MIQNYYEDELIVWSAVAKQFNITTTNGGHMVKQLAVRSGLNVESPQFQKDNDSPRNRMQKKRTSDSKVPELGWLLPLLSRLIETSELLRMWDMSICLTTC